MSDSILHPIAIARVMTNFAQSRGVDQDSCLLGTGISAAQFEDPETLITRTQELRLVENLLLALGDDPTAGFELGLRYNVATFGPWGFALRTSRDLRSAARYALRFLPLSTAYCHIALIDETGRFGLTFDGRDIPAALREFLMLRDLATGLNLLRELSLSGTSVQSVELAMPARPALRKLPALAECHPRFGAGHNAVMLSPQDAARPLPTYDPVLVRMLEDQCRRCLEHRQLSGSGGQLRQLLLGDLGLAATLEEAAEAMTLSPRSLRRRLDEEGTSFRRIVEDQRRQLAAQLLRDTRMTLDEIAAQLGYFDTASFTRAFRRWHGQSPGRFRQRAISG